jgi:hypothetical protein
MACGGTFVRPGAVAWGRIRSAPDGAYSSCDAVEQVLAAVIKAANRHAIRSLTPLPLQAAR